MKTRPKKIIYLFGAGATQAELNYRSDHLNLLMKDSQDTGLPGVSTRIMGKVRKDKQLQWLYEATKSTNEIDIEQLISLVERLNLPRHKRAAEKLRALYYKDILGNLRKTKVLKEPKLAMALFELHRNKQFLEKEKLAGIIGLNHDYLLETACNKINGGVNLGINFKSSVYTKNEAVLPIIKLYGSFNWRSGKEIKLVEGALEPHQELLWIPPTIAKEAKRYPFNKLLGTAYELLVHNCNVLRIVGCSLSQNDWEVIFLIFEAQSIRRDECFDIELIQGVKAGEEIQRRLGYLRNIKSIAQLDGSFAEFLDNEPGNPYEDWLRKIVDDHKLESDLGPNLHDLYYKGLRAS